MHYRITVNGNHIDVNAHQFRMLESIMQERKMGANIDDSNISIEPVHLDADDPFPQPGGCIFDVTLEFNDGDTRHLKFNSKAFSLLSDAIVAHRQGGYMDGWSRIKNCYGEGRIIEYGKMSGE